MIFKQIKDDYIVRIDKGELLTENLLRLTKDQNIMGAWISGLGGALWAEVGFYNLTDKQYKSQKIEKLLEITSLTGNISWMGAEPVLHIHGTFSDEDMGTYGGHVLELAVAGTCELRLTETNEPINRMRSEEVGLNLFNL